MDYVQFLQNLGFTPDEFILEAPLKERSWFKVGGAADVLLSPFTTEHLPQLFSACTLNNIPITLLGDGSNLVISDEGVAGIVLCLQSVSKKNPLDQPTPTGIVQLPAGALIEDLALHYIRQGFAGLETFYGLPGTLGGALYMNARCYDREMADLFMSAEVLDPSGDSFTVIKDPTEWAYKESPFSKKQLIILNATLQLKPFKESIDELLTIARSYKEDRTEKGHFKFPCAGSVFKNDRSFGKPSGQIIDNCNLKGLQVGGAQVSHFHANIIINLGHATACDIKKLVELVQSTVYEQTKFKLEPEILFVGRNFTH